MAVSTMTAPDVEPRQRLTKWLIGAASVVMLAGLLFGYDQGVIGGALDGIKQSFDIGTFAIEVITSWVTLGALVGALVAGGLADKIGRRQTIILAGVLFTAGAAIEAFAPGTFILVVGRLTVGFGVGVASVAAPLYAAEMAPTRLRGRFVSMYQLAITIGIFIAYLIDSWLASEDRWRVMLGLSAVPALLLVLAMLPLPDSPNWYLKVGRAEDARKTLREAQPDGDVDTELATFIAIAFVDRLGRRPLLFTGLIGMGLALVTIGFCFAKLGDITVDNTTTGNVPSDAGVVMLIAMVVFIGSFAFSLGPVVWTVINEIYPSGVRGRGVAVATAANWGSAWLVTQFFLTLTDTIGEAATFYLFAFMCAVAFVFIWFLLPETRGRSLAQIQQMWEDRSHRSSHTPQAEEVA